MDDDAQERFSLAFGECGEDPRTGRPGLFGCLGHIIGFDGMDEAEAIALLGELWGHQSDDAFGYRHRWEPDMLLNRTTIATA